MYIFPTFSPWGGCHQDSCGFRYFTVNLPCTSYCLSRFSKLSLSKPLLSLHTHKYTWCAMKVNYKAISFGLVSSLQQFIKHHQKHIFVGTSTSKHLNLPWLSWESNKVTGICSFLKSHIVNVPSSPPAATRWGWTGCLSTQCSATFLPVLQNGQNKMWSNVK